jgi:uroporphyrinogen-III synthase
MTKEGKVKTILISQNLPEAGKKNIFDDIAIKCKVKIDYRSFIQVDPVPGREVRRNKVNILNHTAIIFNSKNAVDHFFRVVEELRVELPQDMKYFCLTEGIGLYIQKYIFLRKRKVFYPKTNTMNDFFNLILNHKTEKYLFPCSDIRKANIPDFFKKNKLNFVESTMYKTVSADLSDLENVFYDIIVFFSPADIKSLFDNFPNFKQNNTRIAAFGDSTQKAIKEYSLFCNIPAPTKENPSIITALENYIKEVNS